jgi:hypothetical protein
VVSVIGEARVVGQRHQPLGKGGAAAASSADHQDGVVAGNRP